MLSEINHSGDHRLHDATYMKCLLKDQFPETERKMSTCWGWESEWELTANWTTGNLEDDGNTLNMDYGDGCITG